MDGILRKKIFIDEKTGKPFEILKELTDIIEKLDEDEK